MRLSLVILIAIALGCSTSAQNQNLDATPEAAETSNDDTATDKGVEAPVDTNPAPDAASCAVLNNAYLDALAVAKQCAPVTEHQCATMVTLPLPCHCRIFVNNVTDQLTAAATNLEQSGCGAVCNGACALPTSATCEATTAGATTGMCK